MGIIIKSNKLITLTGSKTIYSDLPKKTLIMII